MKINLLGSRVLVKPIEVTKTAGGIIIPETAKDAPVKGTVIEVGPGTKDETMVVKVGDTVLYGKYVNNQELNLNGEKYILMKQHDIVAIVTD